MQIKDVNNTGFGNNTTSFGKRLITKSGMPNIKKTGQSFWEKTSPYHTLLRISWLSFIIYTFLAFVAVNLIFTILYYMLGIQHLSGIQNTRNFDQLAKVFFFSVQTFTTVGYGHISPSTVGTSALSGVEAFCGLLFFALVTGLLYARFSKPNAFIKFSFNAVIAPYEDKTALMFRMVPYKDNHLTDVEVKLTLALVEEVNGTKRTEFYIPKLEIEKVNSLVLSWTVVHPIDADSPLTNFKNDDFTEKQFELIVFVRAFDDTYSSTVVARTSYTFEELKYGYKFEPMYQRATDDSKTILNINSLNEMRKVTLSSS